jgi:hypothetical protein
MIGLLKHASRRVCVPYVLPSVCGLCPFFWPPKKPPAATASTQPQGNARIVEVMPDSVGLYQDGLQTMWVVCLRADGKVRRCLAAAAAVCSKSRKPTNKRGAFSSAELPREPRFRALPRKPRGLQASSSLHQETQVSQQLSAAHTPAPPHGTEQGSSSS